MSPTFQNSLPQVHGLQVAVVVGLEGDPFRRNDLGLPASDPVVVVVMEVVGTVEVIAGWKFLKEFHQ